MDSLPKFIFIGGAPRSGTTLLQKILGNHSEIQAGPEFDHVPEICQLYSKMQNGITNQRQSFYYNQSFLDNSFRSFLSNFLISKNLPKNKEYISEKTPGNVFAFSSIEKILPDAKYIFVIRDPRAIYSSYKRVFARAKSLKINEIRGKNILKDIEEIHAHIKSGFEFFRKDSSQILLVIYEALIKDPKESLLRIIKFLNINFEESMLDLKTKSDVDIVRNNDTAKVYMTDLYNQNKISSESLYKWKDELTKSEMAYINYYFMRNEILELPYELLKPSLFDHIRINRLLIKNYGLLRFFYKKMKR